jgi:hypothetical protein
VTSTVLEMPVLISFACSPERRVLDRDEGGAVVQQGEIAGERGQGRGRDRGQPPGGPREFMLNGERSGTSIADIPGSSTDNRVGADRGMD